MVLCLVQGLWCTSSSRSTELSPGSVRSPRLESWWAPSIGQPSLTVPSRLCRCVKDRRMRALGSSWLFWTHFLLCFQVVGHKKGLDVMERADPLFLLMGLPTIPVMLVLGKMIRWEDYVVRLWQRHSSKLQIFSGLVPCMWKTGLNLAIVHPSVVIDN